VIYCSLFMFLLLWQRWKAMERRLKNDRQAAAA
jgi:hypothetical protein